MKIIDISWPVSERITGYKDKKVVRFSAVKRFSEDGARESKIVLGSHTGTHLDAPSHLLGRGMSVDKIPLGKLFGKCRVLDLVKVKGCISLDDLEKFEIMKGDIVLFKTKNSLFPSEGRFRRDFVYLDRSGAEFLVEKRVKTVGTDYLGIERGQAEHDTHRLLLRNGVAIVEGLRLKNVKAGEYIFHCLPLALKGLDAAPARAVLMR